MLCFGHYRERNLQNGDPGESQSVLLELPDIASEGLRMMLKEKLLGGIDMGALSSN